MSQLRAVIDQRRVERIAVIKPSALGDVAQSLPLLPALRVRFPSAKISWVIQGGLEDLVAGHPDLDEFLVFRRNGNWRDWQQLCRELWSRKFDLVIDLQGLLRTGIMTAATQAPIRIGLETAREGSHWTTTHILPDTGRRVPAGERYLRVLDALQADRGLAKLSLNVSETDRLWAEQTLCELPRPLLAIHPGARWETKKWPVERFAQVALRATRTWSAGLLILGSPAERDEADILNQHLRRSEQGSSVRNLTGQTTLKQLAALLQRVDAVISNDSGPMHLAAGFGTPTLGIFTCTDAVRSGPSGARHETVSTELACGGSYRKQCPHHGLDHLACFEELSTARVWSALVRLMLKNGLVEHTSAAA